MWRERKGQIVVGIAVLALVQATFVGIYCAVRDGRNAQNDSSFRSEALSGDHEAANIELERADGTRVLLHDIAGTVRLVHFWATWCPPCVTELPGLLETSRTLVPQGLVLVAISVDEDWDVIRRFFGGVVPREIYRAVEGEAHKRYDIFSLPDTYEIASDNRLMRRYGGARDWKSLAAMRHLRAQLQE